MKNNFKARPQQQQFIAAVEAAVHDDDKHRVHSIGTDTGVGKTGGLLAVSEKIIGGGGYVLYMVHTKAHRDQVVKDINEWFEGDYLVLRSRNNITNEEYEAQKKRLNDGNPKLILCTFSMVLNSTMYDLNSFFRANSKKIVAFFDEANKLIDATELVTSVEYVINSEKAKALEVFCRAVLGGRDKMLVSDMKNIDSINRFDELMLSAYDDAANPKLRMLLSIRNSVNWMSYEFCERYETISLVNDSVVISANSVFPGRMCNWMWNDKLFSIAINTDYATDTEINQALTLFKDGQIFYATTDDAFYVLTVDSVGNRSIAESADYRTTFRKVVFVSACYANQSRFRHMMALPKDTPFKHIDVDKFGTCEINHVNKFFPALYTNGGDVDEAAFKNRIDLIINRVKKNCLILVSSNSLADRIEQALCNNFDVVNQHNNPNFRQDFIDQCGNDGKVALISTQWDGLDIKGYVDELVMFTLPYPPLDVLKNEYRGIMEDMTTWKKGMKVYDAELQSKLEYIMLIFEKIRQGFGRGIRSPEEHCIVHILDSRFVKKWMDTIPARFRNPKGLNKQGDINEY